LSNPCHLLDHFRLIGCIHSNLRVTDIHPLGRWCDVYTTSRLDSVMAKIVAERSAGVVAEVSKFLVLSGVVLALVLWQFAAAPVPKG
jgi:hypothetical protein